MGTFFETQCRCVFQQTDNLCHSGRRELTERRHLSSDNDWRIGRSSRRRYAIGLASKEPGEVVG